MIVTFLFGSSNFHSSRDCEGESLQMQSDAAHLRAESAPDPAKLRRIFLVMAALGIVINLDGGAVPAALLQIEGTFKLNSMDLGLIGALVYLGIAFGSLTVGPMLRYISPRRATQITLFLNVFATAMFGSTPGDAKIMLLTFRFLIGFLQAVPAVYFPVWVDEFGPEDSRTTWMAVIQAGAPLGITIGYVLSGALSSSSSSDPGNEGYCGPESCMWRVPFWAQSTVLTLFWLASLWLPRELYDVDARPRETGRMVELTRAEPTGSDASGASQKSRAPESFTLKQVPAGMSPGTLEKVMRPSRFSISQEQKGRTQSFFLDTMVDGMVKMDPRGIATSISPVRDTNASADALKRNSKSRAEDGSFSHSILDSITGYSDPEGPAQARSRVVSAVDVLFPASPASQGPTTLVPSSSASDLPHQRSIPLFQLVSNPIYMCTVLSLSCLFFVVTGIQFWVTAYLVNVIGVDQGPVTPVFGLTSITAPLMGVFIGGYIIDSLGGYQGTAGLALTLKCCAIFGAIASGNAILCVIVPREIANTTLAFVLTIVFIFFTLIFGGAIIPSATGVIVAAVPPELRQLSSAMSMFAFQLLGYALAPLVSALVMDLLVVDFDDCTVDISHANVSTLANVTCGQNNTWIGATFNDTLAIEKVVKSARDENSYKTKLEYGFRVCMFWGVLALFWMICAWRAAVSKLKVEQANQHRLQPKSENIQLA